MMPEHLLEDIDYYKWTLFLNTFSEFTFTVFLRLRYVFAEKLV